MSFNTRYIGEYQTEIWRDLSGDVTIWTSTEMTRCVERAVDDLSRFYPLEAVYEHTLKFTHNSVPFTTASLFGVWVTLYEVDGATLAKPIKPESETVTNAAGTTTYARDTDYRMDYINGRITTIHSDEGGTMSKSAAHLISYTKSQLGIDLSAIITDMIRVVRVEYPIGKVPQQFVAYNIWNDFMYIGSQKPGESQTRITDKEHVAIYYEMPHTAAIATAAPSYPAFLDQVICIGAAAYALLMKAVQYEHQAVTDAAAGRAAIVAVTGSGIHGLIAAALGNAGAKAALAGTALGKVATYLEDTGGSYNAVGILANITDDVANLRNAINGAIAGSDTVLGTIDITVLTANITAVGAALDKVSNYLEVNTINGDGDANAQLILENITGDVANLRDAIVTALNSAKSRLSEVIDTDISAATVGATAWLLEGELLINALNVGGRVAENFREYALAKVAIAQTRANTATGLTQEASTRLSNLRSYIEESSAWIRIGETFIAEASQRSVAASAVASGERIKIEQAAGYVVEANTRLANLRSHIEEAGGWTRIAETFIGEASQRVNEAGVYLTTAQAYLTELSGYLATAAQYAEAVAGDLTLSDRFRAEGLERRNEFWAILKDKAEYRKRMVSIPVRQPASTGAVKATTTQLGA